VARTCDAEFVALSAVMAGVKDVRAAVEQAQVLRRERGRQTVLFLDEVHRFNKSQQDAFLPYVEDGTVCFIGATTENPSFEINGALLSRARVYVLRSLTADDIRQVLQRAAERETVARGEAIELQSEALETLVRAADGDARRALNLLEVAFDLARASDGAVTETIAAEVSAGGYRRFDKKGEQFYDQISALHKAVRGTDPDAALYWLCRMLDGGCDPRYVARRVLRMASEDIGNADPRALALALQACETYERLGSPEGELAIAQAVVFMACAAKSNAVYVAFGAAMSDAQRLGTLEVPLHLRNAPTGLMKGLGYGKGYRYAHDEPEGYAAGEKYFPDEMQPARYYEPVERGLEIRIREALERFRSLSRPGEKGPA
jgi:putative ATPase